MDSKTLWIYCSIFVWIHVARGQGIAQGPENSASLMGEEGMMLCRISDFTTQSVGWTFYPNGTIPSSTVYFYDGSTGQEEKPYSDFDVDSDGREEGVFDLKILQTSPSMAGNFRCALLPQLEDEDANFVSVNDITCDPPPGEKTVIVGEYVDLICEVYYSGYKAPYLNWRSDQSDFPGERMADFERSRIVSNVTADPIHDGMQFRCDLSFVKEASDSKDAPTYNDSCTTFFYVEHGATSIIITPDPGDIVTVHVGEIVNCTASGRPLPVIMWEEVDGGSMTMGEHLHILEDWADSMRVFTCIARNEIDGIEHFARLNISLNIMESIEDPVTTTGGTEAWVIAVAVIVPIVIIAIIVVVVFFCLKDKKKKKKGKAAMGGGGPMGPGPDLQFSNINQQPNRGVPPPRGRYPPGERTAPGQTPNGQSPPVMDVKPEQQTRSGKDSPGYGDLGIKQFGSMSHSLAASVEFDPDPRYTHNPKGSQNQLGPAPARGPKGSQGSLLGADIPPNRYEPPNYQANQGAYGSQASINRIPMARGQMGSQGSLSQVQAARGYMGSQGSLSQVQAARGYMGSQGSLSQVHAARGNMGSQRSLASQGSREYGNVPLQLPYDVPDTTV